MATANSDPNTATTLWGIPAGNGPLIRHALDPQAERRPYGEIARCKAELVSVPPPTSQCLLAAWPACRECVRLECEARGVPAPNAARRRESAEACGE